jgi:hypothetical protein
VRLLALWRLCGKRCVGVSPTDNSVCCLDIVRREEQGSGQGSRSRGTGGEAYPMFRDVHASLATSPHLLDIASQPDGGRAQCFTRLLQPVALLLCSCCCVPGQVQRYVNGSLK